MLLNRTEQYKAEMAVRRYVDWLSEAEDDLSAARDLLRLKRYSKACFFAQQAAEKALKALLMYRAGVFETTHSVVRLLEVSSDHGIEVPDELFRTAEELDRLYIPTRYPNAWPYGPPHVHYDEEDARRAVENAGAVFRFVGEQIKEAPR